MKPFFTKDQQYLAGMQMYIETFRALPAEEAKKIARRSLIQSGVLHEDGSAKEKIVDAE